MLLLEILLLDFTLFVLFFEAVAAVIGEAAEVVADVVEGVVVTIFLLLLLGGGALVTTTVGLLTDVEVSGLLSSSSLSLMVITSGILR